MQITTIKNNIIRTEIPGLSIPNVLLPDFLIPKLLSYGDKLCFIDGDTHRSLSYRNLVHLSRVLATSLQRRGVKQGDYICLHSKTSIELWICYLAVIQLGAVTVLAKGSLNLRELLHILTDSKPSYIIVDEKFSERVREARKELDCVKDVYVIGKSNEFTSIDELLQGDDISLKPLQPTDPSTTPLVLPYSSGTTGFPKAVVLSHKSIVSLSIQEGPDVAQVFGPEDVVLGILPATHASGGCMCIGLLYAGSTSVLIRDFKEEQVLQLIEKYKITVMPIFPSQARSFLYNPLFDVYDVSSVKSYFTAGSSTPPSVFEKALEKFNLKRILHFYGMTEIIATFPEPGSLNYKHVGKPVAFTDMKVVDVSTGQVLPPYQEGELCSRGPQMFIGYLGKPEAFEAVIDEDGFYHSGDVGYYDNDGNIFYTDRIKELIKCMDQQVSPSELEAILVLHPGIKAAAVTGIPHEKFGEAAVAFVVKEESSKILSENEVMEYIAGQCSYHKHLHGGVHFVTSLPVNETGKYMRRLLRDNLLTKIKNS